MCFAPQRCALFCHHNFQKWSEADVFCTLWLPHVLRATTACNFSSLIWPDGSAPAALPSLLFDPPEPQIIEKTQWIGTFLAFRAPASSFFWFFLFSDLLSSSLVLSSLLFSFLLWLFPPLLFHLSILSEVSLLNFLRPYMLPTFFDARNIKAPLLTRLQPISQHSPPVFGHFLPVKHHQASPTDFIAIPQEIEKSFIMILENFDSSGLLNIWHPKLKSYLLYGVASNSKVPCAWRANHFMMGKSTFHLLNPRIAKGNIPFYLPKSKTIWQISPSYFRELLKLNTYIYVLYMSVFMLLFSPYKTAYNHIKPVNHHVKPGFPVPFSTSETR